MTFAKTSICVSYKFVDGWHIFSSEDMPELYVASQDADAALNDIAPSIQLLIRLNDGIHCAVEEELEFSEFVERARKSEEPAKQRVLSHKRFAVYAAVPAAAPAGKELAIA